MGNKEEYQRKNREYRLLNLDKITQRQKEYQEKYPEKIKETRRKYKRNNKGKINALTAKRWARKKNATPPWLTEDDLRFIELFYKEARRLTMKTGIQHEVDHICPLQGKTSCGLHVPWNLQILTKSENVSKGNKLWIDQNQ